MKKGILIDLLLMIPPIIALALGVLIFRYYNIRLGCLIVGLATVWFAFSGRSSAHKKGYRG